MRLGSQRLWFLAGFIPLLAGLVIAVTLTYLPRWVGLILMLLGLFILFLTARKKTEEEEIEGEEITPETKKEEKKTLATILINLLTLNGRIKLLLPVIGAILILFVYAYNFFFRKDFTIGVNDTIALLLGATLMLYNYVPEKFGRERDFIFLFFLFLFLILVLPIGLYEVLFDPIPENPNSPFIFYLLARPTADMLNFIGIPSSAHSIPPYQAVKDIYLSKGGVWIVYKNLGDSQNASWNSVGIGLSCTGLYSVSIFISGFISFVLLEYRKLDIRVASLLTLGVFTSWFANIMRMTIIVAVGSHYGREALVWTHENLGIFIFMLWVGLFWGLMFKLLVPVESGEDEDTTEGRDETEKDEHNNNSEAETEEKQTEDLKVEKEPSPGKDEAQEDGNEHMDSNEKAD